jgi:hypothetical protein
MNCLFRFYFFALITLLFRHELHAGGWEWKGSAEGGYFDARGDYNTERIRYLTALSGSAKFNLVQGSNTYLLNLRLRPEWYGPQSANYMINVSGAFQYQRTWKLLELNAGVQLRRQHYHLDSGNVNLQSEQLFGIVSWPFTGEASIDVEIRYGRAEVSGESKSKIHTLTFLPGLKYFYSRFGSLSGNALVESFKTSSNDPFSSNKIAHGWRAGPQLIFEYSRNWLINLQYLFADRMYEKSDKHHIEQEINLVIGKNLTPKWSLFILADYYFRKADSTSGDPVNAQTDYENRVHAKLVYSWASNKSVYMKLAYSRNELPFQNITLSGSQIALGIEVKK